MKLKIIIGTGRNERYSDKVAKAIFKIAKEHGLDASLLDVRDFASPVTVPNWQADDITDKYRTEILAADAFVFVIPEYNHGYPGELKILLDRTKYEYGNKPVYLCGVSSGSFGGARVIEHILPILNYLSMDIRLPALYFSNVQKIFDKQGQLKDDKLIDRIVKLIIKIKENKIG